MSSSLYCYLELGKKQVRRGWHTGRKERISGTESLNGEVEEVRGEQEARVWAGDSGVMIWRQQEQLGN
jgi:hypothetical protein